MTKAIEGKWNPGGDRDLGGATQDKGEKYWGWGDRRREGVYKKSWFEFAAKKNAPDILGN